jgi:hypothetical protein
MRPRADGRGFDPRARARELQWRRSAAVYALLDLALFLAGARLLVVCARSRARVRCALGLALVIGAALFFPFLELWGEMLWFEALGQEARFWRVLLTRVACASGGAALGLGGVWLLTAKIPAERPPARVWPEVLGTLVGGALAHESWREVLLFLHRVPTGLRDPILGRDTGFYLFVLPLLDRALLLAASIAAISLAAALAAAFVRVRRRKLELGAPAANASAIAVLVAAGALAIVLAASRVLAVFHLMYSEWGVVAGPGWTDVHVRLPALWAVAAITLAGGLLPLVPGVRRRLHERAAGKRVRGGLAGAAAVWAGIAAGWALGLAAVPALVQWLVVVPNEITFEAPYIAHNIRFTRAGFGLEHVEEQSFPAASELGPGVLERNRELLAEIRLWDWRALKSVYEQFEQFRLYYEFHDVDIDRYRIDGRYRQVMVAARELDQRNLPPQSRTFVNERFKYTHGYGLTLATVSDFTPQGLPNLLIEDIPPRSASPSLTVERPQIYHGELTHGPVVVNTTEEEFDYPSGDRNVYTRYSGNGGVHLKSLWRKFVFGSMFDGTRFFLSSYPTSASRVLFHRQVRERVARLAPFLELDEDPYVVLHEGRLVWVVDGYTTSRYFPYSEPYDADERIEYQEGQERQELLVRTAGYLHGVNYLRNSVKAVVDAYDGSVRLFAYDPDDPLVRAWRGAFPELFADASEMPSGLVEHVRYPLDFLLVQGLVYAKYHMTDPAVFYNQEDLWIRATEKYYSALQPVEPYYVMWQRPGAREPEFVLILPFTPKNRQVLIGWIAGLCDPESYGGFLAYKFPKDETVLGPQQVETKIDQDSHLSGQLTMWDQRGSSVIRGNVLAIPIEDTLLYVEPIYLQAETAAYPELRLVAVMHGHDLSYAETFAEAVAGLRPGTRSTPAERPAAVEPTARETARRAEAAFERYLELQARQDFDGAAEALRELRDALRVLAGEREGPPR